MKAMRSRWQAASVVILLVVGTIASLLRLSEAKTAAADASANLDRITGLAHRIELLRRSENRAAVQGEQKVESSKNWIEYAQVAQIRERQISKIDPLPLKKLGNSDYSREDVFIQIKGITAKQLVQFLLKCESVDVGYQSSSVRLSQAPNVAGEQDLWNVDLVLTRMLFTATNPAPGR